MSYKNFFVLVWLFIAAGVSAQSPAFPQITFPVQQNGMQLAYPFTGGLNAPQFSVADLNNDGADDLVVFDRAGEVVLTFINNLTGGTSAFKYAPEYARTFPKLMDYMLLRDYNNDGAMDIFCAPLQAGQQEIHVFKGYYQDNVLKFEPFRFNYPNCPTCEPYSVYYPDQIPGLWNNFPIAPSDLPAIADADGDGDLDIVAFPAGTSVYLTLLKNTSVEEGFGLDSLHFVLEDNCWGKFYESGIDKCRSVLSGVPTACAIPLTGGELEERDGVHPGASILMFDHDSDGDQDLLLGNISFNCLNLLINGGSPQQNWMTSQDSIFPKEDVTVDMLSFPAAYSLDIDNDGVKDLLVSPNSPTLHEDRNNVWWYKNINPGGDAHYELQTKKLFTSGMIDMGTATHPVFADVNGDGLYDLVVGNYGFYSAATSTTAQQFTNARLYLYLNTGSFTAPAFTLADEDWLGLSSVAPNEYEFAPAFGDLDSDGDLDLLVGNNLGSLYCFYNQAASGQPMNLQQDFNTMWISMDVGQTSTPTIIDLDGDGLVDILMGERNGNINFYKNIGSATEPQFEPDENSAPNIPSLGAINTQIIANGIGYSAPQVVQTNNGPLLVSGTQDGHVEAYTLAGATASEYPLVDMFWGNIDVGFRSTPAFADINDDGVLEMVVGNLRGGVTIFKTSLAAFTPPLTVSDIPQQAIPFKILPNPASQSVEIIVKSITPDLKWDISDMLGRVIQTGAATGINTISTANLPNGTYAVRLYNSAASSAQKLLIQH